MKTKLAGHPAIGVALVLASIGPGGALAPTPSTGPGGALAPTPSTGPGAAIAPTPSTDSGAALAPAAIPVALADGRSVVPATPTSAQNRAFFLDCACEDCVPAEGLPRGRYWIVSRPILTGRPDDFPRILRLFREELSSRFRPAEELSGTVVLRHRPDPDAARRTRQMIVETRSSQGYRILELDFRPAPAPSPTGARP